MEEVDAGGEIVGVAGLGYEERAEGDEVGQDVAAADEDAAASVEAGAPVIVAEVVGYGGEGAKAAGVGFGEVEDVVAEEAGSVEVAEIEVGDELVLVEDALRLVLVEEGLGGGGGEIVGDV